MINSTPLVVFRLDLQRYALELEVVERVIRAVEVTPLPSAPEIVLGVIDMEGRVLPVLNLRRRFNLPEREIHPDDQFLVARTSRRLVALFVDAVEAVIERPESGTIGAAEIVPGVEQIRGVIQLEEGLVLIHDLERFLSLDEAQLLDEAINQEVAHGA
jgi:purine-binding chemotaxis protein CheW